MTITIQEFRDALSRFASGVTLVTSKAGDKTHGMTVSAFCPVSLDPPVVSVAIGKAQTINPLLEGPDTCFAVNILAEDQQDLSDRFAFKKDESRFLFGDWTVAETGAPVLQDAVAWFDCTVIGRHEVGTHTIYLGSVVAVAVPRPDEKPLLYWNRGYRGVTPESVRSAPEGGKPVLW